MLKLAKGKGERGKEHKGAKAGTRFISFLSSAVPAQAGLGVRGSAGTPAHAHPGCASLHRVRGCHGCLCATLPGQAHMRQPDTLKQMMFLKCECKLGHAWTEPEGTAVQRAPAAAGCSGRSPLLGWLWGELHIAPRQPPPEKLWLEEFRLKASWRSCIPLGILALRKARKHVCSEDALPLVIVVIPVANRSVNVQRTTRL